MYVYMPMYLIYIVGSRTCCCFLSSAKCCVVDIRFASPLVAPGCWLAIGCPHSKGGEKKDGTRASLGLARRGSSIGGLCAVTADTHLICRPLFCFLVPNLGKRGEE